MIEIHWDWTGANTVSADEVLLRSTELLSTRADASKIGERLGWKPTVSFDRLVAMMVGGRLQAIAASVRR
jgi:GDP-D-mannose dehydratase